MRFFFQKKIFIFSLFFLFVSGLLLYSERQSGNRFYQEGLERLKNRDYSLAESLLNEYVKNPSPSLSLPDGYLGLAIAKLHLGREKEALSLLNKLNRTFNKSHANQKGIYWRAICFYNEKKYKEAAVLLEEYLRIEWKSADFQEVFLSLKEMRQNSFLYLSWAYYKENRREFAYKSCIRAINEGVPIDFHFSFFSLFASLLQERGEIDLLAKWLRSCDETKWGKVQQIYCKLYRAEVHSLLSGEYAALPFFSEIIELSSLEDPQLNRLFLYCYQRIFSIYESRNEFQKMSEVALFFHQKAKEDYLIKYARELMLRSIALNLELSHPDEVLRFTDLLLEENSLDVEAWCFRIKALQQLAKEPQEVSYFQQLPELLKERLLETDGGQILPNGDFLLIRIIQEWITAGNESEAIKYAQFLLERYNESEFYLQALHLKSYGLAKIGELQGALRTLKENEKYRSLQYLFQETLLDPWFDANGFRKEMNEKKEEEMINLFFLEAHLLRVNKEWDAALKLYDFLIYHHQKKKIDLMQRRLLFHAGLTAFQKKDFVKLQQYRQLLLNQRSSVDLKDRILLTYFEALGLIAQKKYEAALVLLNSMEVTAFEKNQLEEMGSWFLYYRAWANYRFGEYEKAEKEFLLILQQFPLFEWNREVQKLAGWAALSCGKYDSAATLFEKAANDSKELKERDRNLLLQGRALVLGNQIEKGENLLKNLGESKNSFYGDHALMELAASFYRRQAFSQASDCYWEVVKRYEKSVYAQEALFLAAESQFVGKNYLKASELYATYQKRYPKGENFEMAFYRYALSLMKGGKLSQAAFEFQKLLEHFPNSFYRSQILLHLGEIAAAQKEWAKASSWYRELQNGFPTEAKNLNVGQKLSSLFFRQQGKSSKESEWLVLIQENGLKRRRGREAALQLADLYLTLYRDEENRNIAIAWLEEIVLLAPSHLADVTEALSLLAEDAKRVGEYKKAMDHYIQAVSWNKKSDKGALFLHQAVLCALEAGSGEDALFLLNLMKKDYSTSSWIEKTESLSEWQRLPKGVVHE